MKAVRLHGTQDLRVETVDEPVAPGDGEVLIGVAAAGICGSDIHNYQTGRWITRAPSVAGHEFAGHVLATGPGVTDFRAGDLVVADSRYWCGHCGACNSGNPQFCETLGFVGEVCDGGFAERTLLPERLLHKVDAGVPPEVAATAEPLAVALHAVRQLAALPGVAVLVAGCGMIGALTALLLSRQDNRQVLIADRNGERVARVCAVTGARPVTLDAASASLATAGQGIACAVEATGSAAVLAQLLGLANNGGRIVLVGIFHGTLELDPTLLVERELSLLGCHAFRNELPEAVSLLGELSDGIAGFLDCGHTLDDVPQAYRRIIAGEVVSPKTIIRCR